MNDQSQEPFEDHLAEWFGEFHRYLTYSTNVPQLLNGEVSCTIIKSKIRELPLTVKTECSCNSQLEGSPGVLFQLQAAICSAITLYVEKYEEETQQFLSTLMADVWGLLIKLGNEVNVAYDGVCFSILIVLLFVFV